MRWDPFALLAATAIFLRQFPAVVIITSALCCAALAVYSTYYRSGKSSHTFIFVALCVGFYVQIVQKSAGYHEGHLQGNWRCETGAYMYWGADGDGVDAGCLQPENGTGFTWQTENGRVSIHLSKANGVEVQDRVYEYEVDQASQHLSLSLISEDAVTDHINFTKAYDE